MIRWVLFGICFSLCANLQAAPSAESLYQQALTAPSAQQPAYLKAAELQLRSQIKLQPTALLWIDLSTIQGAQNRPVEALYSAQKALELEPRSPIANQKAHQLTELLEIERAPRTFGEWVGSVPEWVYGSGLLVAYLSGLLLFKSKASRGAIGASMAVAVTFGALLWGGSLLPSGNRWMVMEAQSGYQGPGLEFTRSVPLQPATLVRAAKQQGRWILVERKDQTFWLPTDHLKAL